MRMSSSLYFASSNQNKFEEARVILSEFGISLKVTKEFSSYCQNKEMLSSGQLLHIVKT